MNIELKKLLNFTNHDDGDKYTHIAEYPVPHKWNVNGSQLTNFWQTYCSFVSKGEEKMYLKEHADNKQPIVVTANFKFLNEEQDENELFTNTFLIIFVYCFQFVIHDLMVLEKTEQQYISVVLEDNPRIVGSEIWASIKIHFPYVKCDLSFQKKHLITEVIKKCIKEKVLSHLEYEPIYKWDKIIEVDKMSSDILLYGSSETEVDTPYHLFNIFKYITDDDISKSLNDTFYLPEMDDDDHLLDVFSVRQHAHVLDSSIDQEKLGDPNDNFFLFPFFLSVHYCTYVTYPKEAKITPSIRGPNRGETSKEFQLAIQFMNMIDVRYLDPGLSRKSFILIVGSSLYNSAGAEKNKAVEYWKRFIKEMNKSFAEGVFKDRYNPNGFLRKNNEEDDNDPDAAKYIKDHKEDPNKREIFTSADYARGLHTITQMRNTHKTLAWYAKETNYNEYNKTHKEKYNHYMTKALDLAEDDVAAAFFEVFWLDFNFDGCWFYYNKDLHKWKRDMGDSHLQTAMREQFIPRVEQFRTDCSIIVQESKNEDKKNRYEQYIKKAVNLIFKLKTNTFRTAVIKFLKSYFQKVPNFEVKLDGNPGFLGMRNCVIDTSVTGIIQVRHGIPEDYIGMETATEYPYEFDQYPTREMKVAEDDEFFEDEYMEPTNPTYEDELLFKYYKRIGIGGQKGWKHRNTVRLLKWIRKVFVDEDTYHYFLKDCSAFLRGRNSEKLLRIYSGAKDASKSMIVKLKKYLGDYFVNLPENFLSGKNGNGNSATPAWARLKGTHGGVCSELDDNANKMTAGTVKKSVAGDDFYARYLNQNGGDTQLTAKVIIQVNTIPEIKGLDRDDATRAKLLIIPFLSYFTDEAPEDLEEQFKLKRFPRDPFFEESISELYSAFVWVMVKFFPFYLNEGLKPPQAVKDVTQQYINEHDTYSQFIRESITTAWTDDKKTDIDKSKKMTYKSVYDSFKLWYKDNKPGDKVEPSNVVRGQIIERIGPMDGNGFWLGRTLVDSGAGANSGIVVNVKPAGG